ncbi:hypothetical protein ACFX10_017815 [Malus domestica]
MIASTTSLALPSLSPKTLALYTLKTVSIAVSSKFEQDEEDFSDDREASPKPKLFVGNLPINVDSAQLTGIFESAGNVKMVEVIIGVSKRQEDDCDEDVRQEDDYLSPSDDLLLVVVFLLFLRLGLLAPNIILLHQFGLLLQLSVHGCSIECLVVRP